MGGLLGRQLVEVLVHRGQRLDLLDAVDAGHQHGSERQVRVPELSGQRNSRRLAFGLLPVIGMRTQADRLRWLYQVDRGLVAGTRRQEFTVGW